MKTNFKFIFLSALFTTTLAFTVPPRTIIGKWFTAETDGSKSYMDFTSAGKFTYTNSGKVLHYGNFKMRNDTFFISDHECGNSYEGTYKLTFVGNDSVSFAVIDDTCSGRMQQIDKGGLHRVTK